MRALLLSLALVACGPPSLPDAQIRAAEAYCERAVTCEWVSDYDSCVDDAEDVFDLAWPTSQCEDSIDASGWHDCLEAMDNLNCDDWARGLTQLSTCDATAVCDG